jgi:hypothetical protein
MTKPGFPPGAHVVGGRNAAATHARAAEEFYAPIIPVVVQLREQGLSLRAIAAELDRRGVRTRWVSFAEFLGADEGGGARFGEQRFIRWSATQVRRVLARAARGAVTQPGGPAPASLPAA